MSRPVRICLVIWLLLSFFFFHKSRQSQQTSVDRPTERWALDFGAGCPVDPAVQTTNTNTEANPARPLSAAELLCRPLPSDLSSVPKLLHQSWKTNEPLLKFEKWSTVCREKHRDWEWVLWTNEDNLNLETFLDLPGEIYRADFSRNLYMYMFSGVYIDLDTDCLRPTSAAFEAFDIPNAENTTASVDVEQINQFAIFGRIGSNESFENSIPNAWMASSLGHPFFLMPALSVRTREWTGPVALYKAILEFNTSGLSQEAAALAAVGPFTSQAEKTKQEIVLLPSHWLYAYDWREKELRSICSVEAETFDAKACQEWLEVNKKGSISITYWSHTHDNKNSHAKNIGNVSHKYT
ncbi:hypothetical protein VE04_07264 [Pseudogymnoascus sp. 24MN13]|nr:hypothetical protein VE04_07264 [Pseudogymnoascus sp. 24MN13]